MGRATRWLRSLLGGGKKSGSGAPPPPSDKKRWAFGRTFKEKDRGGTEWRPAAKAETERRGSYREAAVPARPLSSSADSDEQNKHAIAVAAATAAVAEAAVAAAQAAAAVVRLTSSGRCPSAGVKREDWAAVKIQSAFRGYLARRALRALRGLVKLQALVRGNIVRKQAAETLRCMQALVRVQARTRACRALRSESSRTNKTPILHPGPPTPEKYETGIPVNASNSNRPLHLKRNSSKPVNVETVEWDTVHSSGWNWLDRWMEERYWDSRQTTSKSMMGSGIDDEKNAKILEVDPGKPQYYPKRKNNQLHSCSTHASDPNSHSFATVQDSPSKDSTTAQLSIPSPSSVDMQESLSFPLSAETAELAESPRFYSASSRPGSSRRGPVTPSKSECSQSLFSGYSDYPNYMANTESSRAKVRSQSAPKQRPDFEKSVSVKRMSAHYGFGLQQGSSAATQRPSSLHTRFTNKAYPGSGRLDRLGMPIRM